jgi:hypothetical protein
VEVKQQEQVLELQLLLRNNWSRGRWKKVGHLFGWLFYEQLRYSYIAGTVEIFLAKQNWRLLLPFLFINNFIFLNAGI